VIDDSDEQSDEEFIVDHTGQKRKAFKHMHKEIKEILKDKIVVAHNLPKDFAYLRLT
jgi:DNA polymerase III alpha subunit (gram-positive type)